VAANDKEPVTIGLGPEAHEELKQLKTSGLFREMADAYRFAIAYALAREADAGSLPDVGGQTIFNIGTVDPDRAIFAAVSAFRGPIREPVYRTAERLAEWGVREIALRMKREPLTLRDLLETSATS
jgi:Arc/MetJ-type ribon-helix-helix transcriptional regulator